MNPKEDEESLYNFLVAHRNEIEYVNLTWTWNEMRLVESNLCLAMNEKEYPSEVYHAFNVKLLDYEYSFTGTIEDAIMFAESYNCWDGFEFVIKDGVLELDHTGDNFDYNYHPEDLDPNDKDILEITSLGYYTWYNSRDGNCIAPVYKYQRDRLMLWSEWRKAHPEDK